jgi:methyltransferase-like protein
MEDYYLHHEHMEEHNQPLYFHEFARRVAVSGLQYLGDADFSTMVSSNFSGEVAKTLHELGANDIVQMEQYMDFVRCRYFRKSLICRSGVRLNRTLTAAVVKDLLLASDATPGKELPLDPAQAVSFESSGGYKITCKSPLTKIALRALRAEWPMPLPFAELLARCRKEGAAAGFPFDDAGSEDFLAGEMLTGMAAGVVEWRLSPVPFTTAIPDKPAVTPLARLQAAQGYKVTNLRGELITLDEIHRQALRLLDGTRVREQVTEALLSPVRRGELVLQRDTDKQTVTDEAEMRRLLGPALDKVLNNLARRALLLRAAAR